MVSVSIAQKEQRGCSSCMFYCNSYCLAAGRKLGRSFQMNITHFYLRFRLYGWFVYGCGWKRLYNWFVYGCD